MFKTYEDVQLEIARIMREEEAKVNARLAAQRKGEDFYDLPLKKAA